MMAAMRNLQPITHDGRLVAVVVAGQAVIDDTLGPVQRRALRPTRELARLTLAPRWLDRFPKPTRPAEAREHAGNPPSARRLSGPRAARG
jgi:hypothetical protein